MDYLGKKRILHRDLRAAHVLINDKLETKIFGFHLAIVLKEDEDQYNSTHGGKFPVKWTAIEAALYEKKFTIKSDIWSFGILLVELTTLGQIPYPDMDNRVVIEQVERGYRQPQPSKCPDNIYKIMLSCWHKSPNNRPTFDYLFDFFDNYCVSTEPEVADSNPEQTQLDIYRILQTELTFDKKISDEKEVGEIWKGEWILKTRKPVCIKLFQEGKYKDFIREASIMKLCSHNNVLKLYGITTTVDWIVMEFVYDLNLLEYMRIYKENKINFNQMLHIAAQVACGMNYLGTKRILHKDLRAANVFIDDYHETKIYGFHLARDLGKDEDEFRFAKNHKCPIKWTAPEAALYGKFTIKSDVWSFGIFLVELITLGQIPYQGITNKDCLEKLEMGFRHEKPDNCPENVYKLMLSCWNKEPTKRPTFEYLFNYFDDYVVSAELEKEEIDKYLRSGKNNGDQIQIQYGKEEEQESCEEEKYYTEASGLDVHNVDNTLQLTLPPRIPILGITIKKSSTNKQHVYENVDVSSNSVEDTKLKLHQVDTAGDLAVYKSEQKSNEEEGDHKDASRVDVHSDASDVDKNSQFALPPRIPTLGMNTKMSSTNKLHVYENVDVCSNNLDGTKLRLQEVDTADTITKCDDIPVYLSEEEEDDNKEPCGIEVHSDASADNEILKSGLPSRSLDL